MNEKIGLILITIGFVFDVLGCLGLVRLPDVYCRLQAATKAVTLGTCSILLGTVCIVGMGAAGIKCLLCMVFLLLISPAASHAIARSAHIAGVKLWQGSVVDFYKEDNVTKKS
jgi:multicomponent Na+:H+ antiporter subunit G